MFTPAEMLKIFIITFLVSLALGYSIRHMQETKEKTVCETKQL
jgi:hypothetical protein